MSNKFYTDEEAQELQKLDVFTYLYNYEPSELVKSGKNEYRTATHSSLVISNGQKRTMVFSDCQPFQKIIKK